MADNRQHGDQHLVATETILVEMTEKSSTLQSDPKDHIHTPSHTEEAHSWFRIVS